MDEVDTLYMMGYFSGCCEYLTLRVLKWHKQMINECIGVISVYVKSCFKS